MLCRIINWSNMVVVDKLTLLASFCINLHAVTAVGLCLNMYVCGWIEGGSIKAL